MPARNSTTDLLSHLGSLAFATRLRRLGEWLQRDVTRVYEEQGIPFQARWFAVLWGLHDRRSLSITELALQLRLTHPAINQITNSMSRHGLLESRRDRLDERRRLVRLTKKGQDLIAQLKPVWKIVRQETELLLNTAAPEMMDYLSHIEAALADRDIYTRVRERLRHQQLSKVEIVPYRPDHRRIFRRLNLEWLKEYFAIEPEDERVLRDPEGAVIRGGGVILMAKLDRHIVGTTALIRHNNLVYEIAKMAVTKSARGRHVGRQLALAALKMAERKGASRVILHTSPKLTAALRLYRSLGFKEAMLKPELKKSFHRLTITMQLNLSRKKRSTGKKKQEEI